jgi:hypothetical protein
LIFDGFFPSFDSMFVGRLFKSGKARKGNIIMNKHFYLLGSLFSMTTGLLNAVSLPMKAQSSPPQPQQEAVTTQPKAMITPAVAPRVRDGAGFIFTADFIWWKTNIGGMEYATTGYADGGTVYVPFGSSPKQGQVVQPNFDFEPGFKLGAGLDFAYDGWDLYANYTWLNGETKRNSISSHKGSAALTLIQMVDLYGDVYINELTKESSEWKQHFNVVDLELGRNFFISRHLTLRPHFGLKSAWIDERFKLKCLEVDTKYLDKLTRKQNLWGIGIRAGLNTVWHFSRNWGLYGDIAATGLWSDFHVKFKDKQTYSTTATSANTLNTRYVITEVIPVFELGLGLTYMAWFDDDQYLFQVSAGWEEQVWLDFNHIIDPSRIGNLSLQGLTIKAGFAF